MIFETHAHYDDEAFDQDREELLNSLRNAGIGTVINVCAEVSGWGRTRLAAEREKARVWTAGILGEGN